MYSSGFNYVTVDKMLSHANSSQRGPNKTTLIQTKRLSAVHLLPFLPDLFSRKQNTNIHSSECSQIDIMLLKDRM